MKKIWVRVDPWDKALAIAALESGADAVVLAAGDAPRMKELGALPVVAPDGDLRLGDAVIPMEIGSKADEEQAASTHLDRLLLLRMRDWTVIPLENLVARRGGLMVEVAGAEQARLVTEVLEKGVDGVVLTTRDPEEVRRTVEQVHGFSAPLVLLPATVTRVRALGMGDRVCVDTASNMAPGEGMLVGNTSGGFFLVHAESIETPYVEARPFRVNAGAVHAYLLLPGGRTKYLSEVQAGDEVLIVRHDGQTRSAFVGRSKIERRPLLLVEGEADGRLVSLVLQNAETIRLTTPEGQPVSVATLKVGERVLAHFEAAGRHFGTAVEETLIER